MNNPLLSLRDHGQSVWLDNLRRRLITSGELQRLIAEDGVRGLTSNPAIFEQAIAGGDDYRDILAAPEFQSLNAKAMYECIAVRDIQDAASCLRPVYLESKRIDGYVSLEVSPTLAHDTAGTIVEAQRLWRKVARENVMIKVPGTREGIPAFQQLISEGVNVNVTLLFTREAYEEVAEAYLAGLELLTQRGGDPGKVASVASFFVSRIDTAVDAWLTERLNASHNVEEQTRLRSLLGKVAIASAQHAYQKYLEILHGDRWLELSRLGAHPQRLLWASTGTKNPEYRDVRYVEELIGPDTVNTMPPATLDAFRDHGRVQSTLAKSPAEAIHLLSVAAKEGVPFKEITNRLLKDGVRQFAEAFEKLLKITDRGGHSPGDVPMDCLRVKLLREISNGRPHS